MNQVFQPEQWITLKRCAQLAAVSVRTLWREIAAGTFPEPIRGRPTRVNATEFAKYQEWRKVQPRKTRGGKKP